jgi:integrase
MSRPWKHPDSGYYWFRRRVPDDIRVLVGKREERLSLGTRDPVEAKRLHALKLVEIEERWSNLRRSQRQLSPDEIAREAALAAAGVRRQLDVDPYQSIDWDVEVGATLWASHRDQGEPYTDIREAIPAADQRRIRHRSMCFEIIDRHLVGRGLLPQENDRERLAKALTFELQKLMQQHNALLLGNAGANQEYMRPVDRLPPPTSTPLAFDTILDGWKLEKKPNKKTEYVWKRVLGEFRAFVGHDDVRRVKAENFVEWKADLLGKGLAAKTIRDGKLAPVRAIFQWAADNRKLETNPGARVTIDLKATASERRRGYSEEEAVLILSKARNETDSHLRWAPWISAYTGARIAEICQLRGEDVKEIGGVWCVAFAAEAGSLKNANSERIVPIHPALEAEGFLIFSARNSKGPLFPELKPDRFGSRGGTGTKVISKWIRSLGITDKRISPNHSWRHRLKTLGRRYGLAVDILNAMTGHGRKTVADTYGEFPPEALMRELIKIQSIDVR